MNDILKNRKALIFIFLIKLSPFDLSAHSLQTIASCHHQVIRFNRRLNSLKFIQNAQLDIIKSNDNDRLKDIDDNR